MTRSRIAASADFDGFNAHPGNLFEHFVEAQICKNWIENADGNFAARFFGWHFGAGIV